MKKRCRITVEICLIEYTLICLIYIFLPSFASIPVDQICSRDGQFYAYKYDRFQPQCFGVLRTVEPYQ